MRIFSLSKLHTTLS